MNKMCRAGIIHFLLVTELIFSHNPKSQWKNPIGNQDDANFWVSDDGQKSVITAAPYSVPPTAKPKSCGKHKTKVCQNHV